MNKKELKTSLILIVVLFVTMVMVSGSTYAYFQWQTSTEQQTALNVSVTDDITMTINPAAVTKTGLYPTNYCSGEGGMSGTSVVTIDNGTGIQARPRLKLKIKIYDTNGNNITNEVSAMDANDGNSSTNKPYMYYIKYAITEANGDCTDPIIEGRFSETTETIAGSGWYDSPALTLDTPNGFPDTSSVSFNAKANGVTSHTYKVWVWIDSEYSPMIIGNNFSGDKLQKSSITVSWSENSTVEQVNSVIERPSGTAYAVYSADDTSLRFYRSETPIIAGSTYNGLIATAVYTGFEETSNDGSDMPWIDYAETITSVVFEDEIVPVSTASWFSYFENCTSLDVTKLNTLYVINMSSMFESVGYNATTFSIIGLEKWNTSKVMDMSWMFYGTGPVDGFNLTGLENWDVSKVTNMSGMFAELGSSATTWSIGDLSEWDVSNVTNMSHMFDGLGYDTLNWNIGYLSDWNVSNVTDMSGMFYNAGYNATTFSLNLSGWNTLNVTNMSEMFSHAGKSATTVELNLNGLITSNVTDMSEMFYAVGYESTTILIDLSGWNVSNVIDMSSMFKSVGLRLNATSFSLIGLENWNTSNVFNMNEMFYNTAPRVSGWSLDLSSWSVSNVMYWENFVYGYYPTRVIIQPTWNLGDVIYVVYSEDDSSLRFYDKTNSITEGQVFNGLTVTTLFEIYGHKGYDVGNVSVDDVPWTNIRTSITNVVVEDVIVPYITGGWFYYFENCVSFDLTKLDTSNVVDMSQMFSHVGYKVSTTLSFIGLETWNTSNVTDMSSMFSTVGYYYNPEWIIGDIGVWDTSKVTDMSYMFYSAMLHVNLDLSGWNVCNVTKYYYFNTGNTALIYEITEPSWGMACPIT